MYEEEISQAWRKAKADVEHMQIVWMIRVCLFLISGGALIYGTYSYLYISEDLPVALGLLSLGAVVAGNTLLSAISDRKLVIICDRITRLVDMKFDVYHGVRDAFGPVLAEFVPGFAASKNYLDVGEELMTEVERISKRRARFMTALINKKGEISEIAAIDRLVAESLEARGIKGSVENLNIFYRHYGDEDKVVPIDKAR